MNGPEAARVMRGELQYRGIILGTIDDSKQSQLFPGTNLSIAGIIQLQRRPHRDNTVPRPTSNRCTLQSHLSRRVPSSTIPHCYRCDHSQGTNHDFPQSLLLAEFIHHFVSNGANELISKSLTKAKLLSALQHYARLKRSADSWSIHTILVLDTKNVCMVLVENTDNMYRWII